MIEKQAKKSASCVILWDELTQAQWEERFAALRRSSLLQSLPYGRAAARINHQTVHHGLITIEGREAGLVQVLEAGILGGALQGVVLDRGPHWFKGYGSRRDFEVFMQGFSARYPKRFGRRVRIIPDMPGGADITGTMRGYGYALKGAPCYETIWLDLRPEHDALRARLKPSWRNKLRRGEKAGLAVAISDTGAYYDWLLTCYARDKKERGYDGPSVKMLVALAREFLVGKKMLTACALLDGAPIAAIVVFIHGSSATYQTGYTTEEGRRKCAHHLLLWRVMQDLKERSVYDFDLGGLTGEASGLTAFKKALGGELVRSAGLYC